MAIERIDTTIAAVRATLTRARDEAEREAIELRGERNAALEEETIETARARDLERDIEHEQDRADAALAERDDARDAIAQRDEEIARLRALIDRASAFEADDGSTVDRRRVEGDAFRWFRGDDRYRTRDDALAAIGLPRAGGTPGARGEDSGDSRDEEGGAPWLSTLQQQV